MKELWTANPFHLMNRPFAEMGYNSSGLNIVPERLLLATRRPSMHYPLASGAPSFGPLRATCRRATNHLQHTAQHLATPPRKSSAVVLRSTWRPPAQHPSSRRKPSAISLRAILWPLRSIRRLSASHLPASSPRDARRPPANHLPSHGTASADPRASSAGTLQAICWHEPTPQRPAEQTVGASRSPKSLQKHVLRNC